jgi:GH15 family glucan-1,4-alpha-glucosidase
MINRDRLTARLEGGFVVFLIGMRINNPLLIHKWWPVAAAMPRMLKELNRQPELGFLHSEMWFSRTLILLQYWRSMEHLMNYAKAKEAAHLPAWQAFNKAIGANGSVGIWHETYQVSPGGYENVYVNMPPFGLGCAGTLHQAKGNLKSAADRLGAIVK